MKGAGGKVFAFVMALAICMAAACPAVAATSETVTPDAETETQEFIDSAVQEDELPEEEDDPSETVDGSLQENDDPTEQTDEAPEEDENLPEQPDESQPESAEPLAAPMALGISGADVVYTAAELSDWLENNTEGTVTLGDNIELTSAIFFYGPVTIDTGTYGLILNGGYFLSANDIDKITISGEGVDDTPVVDVHSLGRLYIGDWNNYLYMLNITATGRDGAGGTALRINGSGSGTVSFSYFEQEEPGQIRSVGTGAIGVELTESFDLFFFNIETEGEDSAAVYAHSDVSVNFCRLSASGSGALAVRGEGEIVVDTSVLEPLPAQSNVAVYQADLFPLWLPMKQGSDGEILNWWMLESVALVNSGPATRGLTPYVTWDTDAYDAISFDELGSTGLAGELYSSWLRGLLSGTPEMIVSVRDPELPCIHSANSGVGYHNLHFWTCDAWGQEDCILWISDDGGETWRDCTDDTGVIWMQNYVTFPESMLDEGVMFVIEVPGFGFSNVAYFSYEYGQFSSDIGGDRVGTDRISVSLSGEKPISSGGQSNGPEDPDEGETGGSTETPGNPGNGTGNPDAPGGTPDNPGNGDTGGSNNPGGGESPDDSGTDGTGGDNTSGDGETGGSTEDSGSPDNGADNSGDSDRGDTGGNEIGAGKDGEPIGVLPENLTVPEPLTDAAQIDIGTVAAIITTDEFHANPSGLTEGTTVAQPDAPSDTPPLTTSPERETVDAPTAAEAPPAVEVGPAAQPALSKADSGAGIAIAVTSAVILIAAGGWLWPARRRVFRK